MVWLIGDFQRLLRQTFSDRFLLLGMYVVRIANIQGIYHARMGRRYVLLLPESFLDRVVAELRERDQRDLHVQEWHIFLAPFTAPILDQRLEHLCVQIRSPDVVFPLVPDNTFYIIWLDPLHNMYPDKRFGGLREIKSPNSCCKDRDNIIIKLQTENQDLKDYINLLEAENDK